MSDDDADELMLSADRFVDEDAIAPIGPDERRHLYDRLGLFGVRLSRRLVREQRATTTRSSRRSCALAAGSTSSGICWRRRSARAAICSRRAPRCSRCPIVLLRHTLPNGRQLRAELEQIQASAHELAELRILTGLRSGALALNEEEATELERLLDPTLDVPGRLGIDDAAPDHVREAVVAGVERWRARAESPLSSPIVVEACQVVGRSLEGMLVST